MKRLLIFATFFIVFFSRAQEKNAFLYTGGSYSFNGGPFYVMQHFNAHIGVSFKRKFFWQLGTGFHNQIIRPDGRYKGFGYWTSNLTYKYRFFAKKPWFVSPMLMLEAGIGYPNTTDKITIESGEFTGNFEDDPANYFRSVNYFSAIGLADMRFRFSNLQIGAGFSTNNVQTVRGTSGSGSFIWVASVSYSYLLHRKP